VNTDATGGSRAKKHSSGAGRWLLAALALIVLGGGWWIMGHPGFRTGRPTLKERAERLLERGHLGALEGDLKGDLKRFEDALSNAHLDEAEQALSRLKAAAAKDARLAALELRLLSARISKAIADGHLDRANALVHEAEQSGKVAAEQLAKWRAEIAAAMKKGSTSSSSSSSASGEAQR
jgi:hypothetical protein